MNAAAKTYVLAFLKEATSLPADPRVYKGMMEFFGDFVKTKEWDDILKEHAKRERRKNLLLSGLLSASIAGAISSYISRKKRGLNPWTGKPEKKKGSRA